MSTRAKDDGHGEGFSQFAITQRDQASQSSRSKALDLTDIPSSSGHGNIVGCVLGKGCAMQMRPL